MTTETIIEALKNNPGKKLTVCKNSVYHEVTDISMNGNILVLHYGNCN